MEFKVSMEVGKDVKAKDLIKDNDAVLLALGATWPRDLPIPGVCVRPHGLLDVSHLKRLGFFVVLVCWQFCTSVLVVLAGNSLS